MVPISISRWGPIISHLIFADDLTFFARADAQNCHTIINTLDSFSKHSVQRVNNNKSKFLFSQNWSDASQLNLSIILEIKSSNNFGRYLGFPTFHKKPISRDFQFPLDNMISKLSGWKTKFLNMAGRTTLTKAFLGSMSNHVMQFIILPNKIHKLIDRT